jgi:hypothetical protein
LTGPATLRRIAISFGVLGLSALLWPLADTVIIGVVLVGLTGVLEGPAFSGVIALRQRHGPPTARAQIVTTIVGLAGIAVSLGATLGGVIHDPRVLIYIFVGLNLLAAGVAQAGAGRSEPISHPASD